MEDFLGASDVAELLGIARQRVYQLIQTHPTFPKPVAQPARGALWRRQDIERWAKGWGRQPGRPQGSS